MLQPDGTEHPRFCLVQINTPRE